MITSLLVQGQLGYLLSQLGRSYIILERNACAGSFFETFPRHRQLISINKCHTGTLDSEMNLKMDWNSLLSHDSGLLFTNYSNRYFPHADDYVRYLNDFANQLNLNIRYNTNINHIAKSDFFQLTTDAGQQFSAQCLLMATGVSKLVEPKIPGFHLVDTYDKVSLDTHLYKNKRVLIIGKGNSAFESADHLIESAAVIHVAGESSIRMAWQSHYVGHLRAVNNNFLDTYQLKSQNAILDGKILEIRKEADQLIVTFQFSRANDAVKTFTYDHVIACTGFRFDASLFDVSCPIDLVIRDRFPKQNALWESTSTPGLHFLGTLMQMRDFKKSSSGFVHGFRYAVRSLFHILNEKYHQVPLPHESLPHDIDQLAKHLVKRVTRASSLWQEFGTLGDVFIIDNNHPKITYLYDLPSDYIDERFANMPDVHIFKVTLEYGTNTPSDPFDINVARPIQNDANEAHLAHFIHPIIRHYYQGDIQATYHFAENLDNDWTDTNAHQTPFIAFINQALGAVL